MKNHEDCWCEIFRLGAYLIRILKGMRRWRAREMNCMKAFAVCRHVSPPLSLIFAGGTNGSYVRSVSFCHDGRHVATVCDDGYFIPL